MSKDTAKTAEAYKAVHCSKRVIEDVHQELEQEQWSHAGDCKKSDCGHCLSLAGKLRFSMCCGLMRDEKGVRVINGKPGKPAPLVKSATVFPGAANYDPLEHKANCKLDPTKQAVVTLARVAATGELPGGRDPTLYNDFVCVGCNRSYSQTSVVHRATSNALPFGCWLCAKCRTRSAHTAQKLSRNRVEALAAAMKWAQLTPTSPLPEYRLWCCCLYRQNGITYDHQGQVVSLLHLASNGHYYTCSEPYRLAADLHQKELDERAAKTLALPGGLQPWRYYKFQCAVCQEWHPREDRTEDVYWMCLDCAARPLKKRRAEVVELVSQPSTAASSSSSSSS